MRRIYFKLLTLTMILLISTQAYAELYNRGTDSLGNRLIYDNDLNITWYDFSFSPDNDDNWYGHMNWAASLIVDFNGNTYDDWRLVGHGSSPSSGWNITSSEMGHLYYEELGNLAQVGMTNTGYFQNLEMGEYWMGPDEPNLMAWNFKTYTGYFAGRQTTIDIFADGLLGLAVRSGDVPQQPIAPEPVSSILFITGATLLAVRRHIRRKKIA